MDLISRVSATPLSDDGEILFSTGILQLMPNLRDQISLHYTAGARTDDRSATALTNSSNFPAWSIATRSFVDGSSKVRVEQHRWVATFSLSCGQLVVSVQPVPVPHSQLPWGWWCPVSRFMISRLRY